MHLLCWRIVVARQALTWRSGGGTAGDRVMESTRQLPVIHSFGGFVYLDYAFTAERRSAGK
jgi:hypothetical protein